MRNSFFKGLYELAERDDKVVFLTGDLGYKLCDKFAAAFPSRFINAGVAEANMVGMAAGLALEGFKPWVYSITPFATLRCFEQIRNDVVHNNLNVKVVGVGGGYAYGFNGPTHHATEDVAVLRTLPGMTIVAPGDPVESYHATLALGDHVGPAYLRLARAGEPVIHKDGFNFELGKASMVVNTMGGICILSTGSMLATAMEIRRRLAEKYLHCAVVSVPTIKPLDKGSILEYCKNRDLVIVLEEHSVIGGFGDSVMAMGMNGPVFCFGIPDELNHNVGDQDYLKNLCGLSAEKICYNIENLLR